MRTILKTAVLLSTLFLFSTALSATPASADKKKQKEESRARVVYFFSKYCEYCNMMDHDVLSDKEIGDMLEKDVAYLRVNVDKNPETARKYGVRGYPTTVLEEDTGRMIAQIPGYISKKEFKKILFFLKEKRYKTTGLGDYLKATKQ